MANERPFNNQNWQGRKYISFGPKCRIDTSNPQMGLNGSSVYDFYAVTDNGDVSLFGLTEGGTLHMYNDHCIEIVGGQKSTTTGVDIKITGKNGDIAITAMKNGTVKIRAANIIIDADENLTLKAGNNITIGDSQTNKIELKANIANCDALSGNLAPTPETFMGETFAGTYVEEEAISVITRL